MNMSNIPLDYLPSLKQALNIVVLRKSLNQDAHAVDTLIRDMAEVNVKILEHSVTPHKGSSIDASV